MYTLVCMTGATGTPLPAQRQLQRAGALRLEERLAVLEEGRLGGGGLHGWTIRGINNIDTVIHIDSINNNNYILSLHSSTRNKRQYHTTMMMCTLNTKIDSTLCLASLSTRTILIVMQCQHSAETYKLSRLSEM